MPDTQQSWTIFAERFVEGYFDEVLSVIIDPSAGTGPAGWQDLSFRG
ncbi:MAG: hypothetical protein GXX08_03570 [Firmicutes bacterium]|mgnify:CR=1|nr:hypothetical protein [Bacillota bacterium]